jgi:hypothetical protein
MQMRGLDFIHHCHRTDTWQESTDSLQHFVCAVSYLT